MPANRRMIEMFHESGFPVEIESSPEGLRVEFPTSLTPEAVARFEERDTIAARVGALAESHREIVALDLNPVLARPDGAIAADSRIRIASAEPLRPWPRTQA